jgi:ATP:corrinoid adenosyltransferase
LQIVRVRLPAQHGLPDHHAAGEVALQTVMAILGKLVASGDYRLVILDGVRKELESQHLDVAQVYRLARCAAQGTEVAMT